MSRIWLDLSSFFSCSRKQSCVFVDHDVYPTVQSVKDHISRLFCLKNKKFHILNDGWLLPASENSRLFRDNDTCSVVPEDGPTFCDSGNKEASALSKCEEAKTVSEPAAKALLASKEVPCVPVPVVASCETVPENTGLKNNPKNPFASPQPPPREVGIIVEQYPVKEEETTALDDDDDGSATESKKRKRIRRRKKKSAPSAPETGQKHSEYLSRKLWNSVAYTLSRAGETAATVTPVEEKDTRKRKHIFFDEPDVSQTHKVHLSEEPQDEQRLPHNDYRDESKTPSALSSPAREGVVSNLNGKHNGTLDTSLNNSLPASGDKTLGLAKLMSLGNQKSPTVFDRKKLEKPKETGAETKVSETIKTITPLTGLPVKGTIIQFRVLKMVNYSPVMSGIIQASVISSDEAHKQVFVKIQDGLSELQTEKGKFSLDVDETFNSDAPLGEYLNLDWQDLIEPKAVG